MSKLASGPIVVPIDYSDESLAAVDRALEIADADANVHVVHVLPVLTPAEPGVIWQEINDDTRRDHAAEALRDKLADRDLSRLDCHILFGDPGHEVADFADKHEATLIVLPSHGRRGIRRLLLGSVAERVVRLAHCPVLVLKGPEK